MPVTVSRLGRWTRRGRLTALALAAVAVGGPGAADAQTPEQVDSVLNRLEWRNIGPAIMGGRIDDIAVVESDPRTFWVGTASAGVWKTENHGTTWIPQFQNEEVSSIGDLAVAPSDPSVVWVGTGEPANRQSSSWGNGVYVSRDGGTTWTHRGLSDTHHIGRVLVHPADPDTVYVAALGHLWGPNEERGVFRTRDGGETWEKVLYGDPDTGAVDLAMDPASPDILYAALYQRRRRAYGFAGGGAGSGIHRTTDGGETWTKLGGGLPEGDTGRIGLDVYRRDPRVVYAIVENRDGGVFRSEDRGLTWTRMSDTNPRPMYYSQIRIDPNNDQRIWVLGTRIHYSQDAGRTFDTEWVERIHVDHHAMWIDPADSDHMLLGNDGGIHISRDRGRTWDFVNTIPLGQFYEIGFDLRTPYMVYGGLQDNGSWAGPSRTLFRQGISNEDWFRIGGGDGFYTQVIPNEPDTVYIESQNGNLRRLNRATSETKTIRPREEPDDGDRYRFDWNSPIVVSPHDPNTVYYGGNRLFISRNRGDEWTRTDDLTRRLDRDEMPIMGVPVTDETLSRHDGISTYGQIVTISESPVEAGVLYVGADDGTVQRSRDGGATWDDITGNLPGVPEQTYVTRIIASAHAAGRVYVTLDGHRNDDYATYVFASEDYGDGFRSLADGLPPEAALNVIREHHDNENLLAVGGEFGVHISLDRGASWRRLAGQIPTVPVDDLAFHPRENDLILGTHGRSVWISDDITPLSTLDAADFEADIHVFPIRDAVAWRMYTHKGNTGHKFYIAENPPEGALIHIVAKEAGEAGITVLDADGQTVRSLTVDLDPGLNRTNWDLRHDPPIPGQGGGFRGPPSGARALPGTYTVRVTRDEAQAEATVVVSEDPRLGISETDRRANHAALTRLAGMLRRMAEAHEAAAATAAEAGELLEAFGEDADEDLRSEVASFREAAQEAANGLSRNEGRPGFNAWPRPLFFRIAAEARTLDAYTEAPSSQVEARIAAMEGELEERLAAWEAVRERIEGLNQALRAGGPPRLTPRPGA